MSLDKRSRLALARVEQVRRRVDALQAPQIPPEPGGGGSVPSIGDIPGLQDELDGKATQTAVNASLALKADTTAVNASLALKADTTAVNASLALKAEQAEVVAARGSRSALNLRISTISNFASPNAGGVIPGRYYDNAFHAGTSSTLVIGANLVHMAPFFTSQVMRLDQLGAAVSTPQAGGGFKCFIYDSDADGWPDQLIHLGASDLPTDVNAYVFHPVNILLDSGRQYWVGTHGNALVGAARVRSMNTLSAVNLGLTSSTNTTYATVIRATRDYANLPMPAQWTFTAGHLTANVTPPSIRMRAATV